MIGDFLSLVILLGIVYLLVNPHSTAASAITFLTDTLTNAIKAAVTGA